MADIQGRLLLVSGSVIHTEIHSFPDSFGGQTLFFCRPFVRVFKCGTFIQVVCKSLKLLGSPVFWEGPLKRNASSLPIKESIIKSIRDYLLSLMISCVLAAHSTHFPNKYPYGHHTYIEGQGSSHLPINPLILG